MDLIDMKTLINRVCCINDKPIQVQYRRSKS